MNNYRRPVWGQMDAPFKTPAAAPKHVTAHAEPYTGNGSAADKAVRSSWLMANRHRFEDKTPEEIQEMINKG